MEENKDLEKTGDYQKQLNETWQRNHDLIREQYAVYMKEHQKLPSISYISEKTGLNWKTVKKHFADLAFEPLSHPLRIFTNDVLTSILKKATAGSYEHQKLWLQVMEGFGLSNMRPAEGPDGTPVTQQRQIIIEIGTTPADDGAADSTTP